MITALWVLVVFGFINNFIQFIIILISYYRLPTLYSIDEINKKKEGLISVIITAKDEENELEDALRLRLKTKYSNIEFIIVNDRSRDLTGEIIKRIAEKEKRVKIVNIKNLPKGWIGKVNALNEGAKIAKGDWLLFSDGDTFISEDGLGRAVNYCEKESLDFLAVLPEFLNANFLVDSVVTIFFKTIIGLGRAYKAKDPKSYVTVGSGSFNMVKREKFNCIGGFEKLKMEVVDDIGLGQILKLNGAKTGVILGKGIVKVRWYSTLKTLFDGMGRAMLVGLGNYNMLQLFVLSTIAFLVDSAPFFGFIFYFGNLRILGVVSILFIIATVILSETMINRPFYNFIFFPVGIILMYLISLYGGIKFMINGGLVWRGTLYSKAELKKGRIFTFFPKMK